MTLVCLGLLLSWGGCRSKALPSYILLISIDTLRADRLGCYGYGAARTPFLDRIAGEGVLFAEARSPVPLTLPSHASILTGMNPPHHGIRNNGHYYLKPEMVTLAERLEENGYDTAAFVSCLVMDGRYGLDQGFQVYEDDVEPHPIGTRFIDEIPAEMVLDRAWSWLQNKKRKKPCFAFIHLFDPHQPYSPPEGFALGETPSDLYDGEIAYADSCLSAFFDKLERAGMTDKMLLVVLSDHGESLGEHGEDTHGVFLYDSTVHVPLLFWKGSLTRLSIPFKKGTTTQDVTLADVAPSLVEVLGLEEFEEVEGRSFAGALAGKTSADSRGFYLETLLPELDYGWAPLKGWFQGGYKYIDAPKEELYDTRGDPKEEYNLLLCEPDLAVKYRNALAQTKHINRASTRSMEAKERRRLEGLGYLSGSHDPTPREKADPKDRVHLLKGITYLSGFLDHGKFEEAIFLAQTLLEEDPSLVCVLRSLGEALSFSGRHLEAVSVYERALALAPQHSDTHNNLGCVYLALHDPDHASKHFGMALANDPNHPEARANLILVSKDKGTR